MFEHGDTTFDGGTGLGLAIVVRIAEARGWTIDTTDGRSREVRFESGASRRRNDNAGRGIGETG